MNANGVLSFGQSYNRRSPGFQFTTFTSPPIITPFWDDINVNTGGRLYYRQESDPRTAEQIGQEISSQFPEAEFFYPSLVFVATWDGVPPIGYLTGQGNRFNTFQVIVASNGTWTFVKFNYYRIDWGELYTLIGISAGDRLNFISHPKSRTTSVLLLDHTNVIYRIDGKLC